jgi:two-component sensor histidine kinase
MTDKPIAETPPTGEPKRDLSQRALELRIRQQQILAELGVFALQGATFFDLLDRTVVLTAEGMEAEFCKVLEYHPAEKRFLVRAGVGWGPRVVGIATIGADLASPAGFALRTSKPVISNHLSREDRFRTPELLLEYGIHRAINVILQGDGSAYGVLEVDSRSEGEFTEHDLAFLQGAAGILGMAIERQRYERELKSALARQEALLREVDHRVKNSLQLVMSILRLQGDTADLPDLRHQLHEAAGRISAIAKVHQRLHQTNVAQSIDLGAYLGELCRDVDDVAANRQVFADTPSGIEIATDRAISVAVLVNELITNAVKHAYADREVGAIWVTLARKNDESAVISVRDEGVGLPPNFDLGGGKTLGMKIVGALAQQLGATLSAVARDPGTEITLLLPLTAAAEN